MGSRWVYELVSKWDKDKIARAYLEAPKKGFNTQLMGKIFFIGHQLY